MTALMEEKVTVVAGGAGPGIGGSISRVAAREKSAVIVADLHGDRAKTVAEEIVEAGGRAVGMEIDLASAADIKTMIATAMETYGRVDLLAYNALSGRVREGDTDVLSIDLEAWDHIFAINVRSAMLATREVLPHMIEQGHGSIVYVSSASGAAAEPVRPAYASSKAALNGLARAVATSYGKAGVRCNSVAPGFAPNPTYPKLLLDMMGRHHLTPRLGRPDDIAEMVVFLGSDRAEFVTGQTIGVDGGLLAHQPHYADFLEATAED